MASTKPGFANCAITGFAQSGRATGNRLDNFLDKFYDQKKFLTHYGLVQVLEAHIVRPNGDEYEFDADTRAVKEERSALKELWIESASATGKKGKIEFVISLGRGSTGTYKIPLTNFYKVEAFGGQGIGGKTLNKGTQFEKDFYADAVKVLEGATTGTRFVPVILKMNEKFEKEFGKSIGMVEADPKLKGVLEEGSANKSRPLAYSGGTLVVAAEGNVTEDMGSTLTDITFQYGIDKTPVYLSLKYGSTLTFFNSGVGGRNGPTLFTSQEIENNKVTSQGGLDLMSMFGIDDNFKFCQSFKGAPRTEAIPNHVQVSTSYNGSAIQKLLRSGIGYGYWMVHNTKGTTVDWYEIDQQYMKAASTLTGGITIYYGRMNGKGKGVNMVCESSKYKFTFNIRNKQGGDFPTHVMCDYKKKTETQPPERPDNGVA